MIEMMAGLSQSWGKTESSIARQAFWRQPFRSGERRRCACHQVLVHRNQWHRVILRHDPFEPRRHSALRTLAGLFGKLYHAWARLRKVLVRPQQWLIRKV